MGRGRPAARSDAAPPLRGRATNLSPPVAANPGTSANSVPTTTNATPSAARCGEACGQHWMGDGGKTIEHEILATGRAML
jgi:hypothetical protein